MARNPMKLLAKKIAEDTINIMKEEAGYEIEKHFEMYIEQFYNHYPNPKYYKRTYSTFLSSDSYEDLNKTYLRNGSKVGIIVTADNIPGNPYYGRRRNGNQVDKDWVFNQTYVEGAHGYFVQRSERINGIRNYSGHSPMETPPYKLMDQWWKNFKNGKRELDKIRDKALDKAINRNL